MRLTLLPILFAAAMALSCDDKGGDSVPDTDADTDTDSGDGGAALDCNTLPPAACLEEAKTCAAIVGLPIIEDGAGGFCVDTSISPVPVGCKPIEAACTEVPSWAAPPADPGACHNFKDDCLPTAWRPCGDRAMEVSIPCPA